MVLEIILNIDCWKDNQDHGDLCKMLISQNHDFNRQDNFKAKKTRTTRTVTKTRSDNLCLKSHVLIILQTLEVCISNK